MSFKAKLNDGLAASTSLFLEQFLFRIYEVLAGLQLI